MLILIILLNQLICISHWLKPVTVWCSFSNHSFDFKAYNYVLTVT